MAAPSDLVRELVSGGALRDPAWRAAFEQVPRELFVPYFYVPARGGGYERLWRDDPDPERRRRWAEGVRSDRPLATRIRDGELVSSSSQPSLMARMLEYLELRDGMDVLEIGTGPGYNAALLCHRLGDARVTTVDLDPEITDAARAHLAAAGHRPHVLTTDGARGCPAHAPYDRIIATCALPWLPPAWLAQCAPDALVLAPVASGLLALRVPGGGPAGGRFKPTPAYFVPLRGGTPAPHPEPEPGPESGVPRAGQRDDTFRFLLTLSGGRLEPGEAHDLWRRAGRPGRERYGVSVRDGRQWAWLDDPEGPYTWPLGEPVPDGRGTADRSGA
ncbi:methyltransferase domain-containing protein [Streptomyces boncukensis]|uniref:Protein-L-isoaspartate O-methyltransferase n=1 Tax=Streptomyces boncukensis TaxID=2711219 RepID=A0A6G4X6N9_9ACTN|nr:methyltransferase domain-containing protein [Streptomyces boncukensis]NGO72530.1 methyltransferase domain-containing protein [Streptomyces boncukensis]